MKLNGTARLVIPIAAVLSIAIGLHVLQQGELGAVRDSAEENSTAVARVEERTNAQFDEIMRTLARIEKQLDN